jgi:hypothetical protein
MPLRSSTLQLWSTATTVDPYLHHHSPLWGVGVVVDIVSIHSRGDRG